MTESLAVSELLKTDRLLQNQREKMAEAIERAGMQQPMTIQRCFDALKSWLETAYL